MFNKRQLATVLYALRYLIANYDEAILWSDDPEDMSPSFKEHEPLSEYELIKLADSLEGLEPKLYQLEISGRMSSFDSERKFVSAKIWSSPGEALQHQDDFLNKVCDPQLRLDSIIRETAIIRVIELELG